MVAIETKELTYEQKLELVFYHYKGKSYHRLLNITEYLKFAAVDDYKSFGENKQHEKIAEVRRLTAPLKMKTNSGCRVLWFVLFCKTFPKSIKSNEMLQNF